MPTHRDGEHSPEGAIRCWLPGTIGSCSVHIGARWKLTYRVTGVDSDFPADIIGLQVADGGPDARVVTVTGEIDTLTAPKLASFLNEQLSAALVVVVDLNGVEFLGSAGLSALFEANELANRKHRTLRLVCHSRIANRALEATELRDQFAFADTVPDALKNPR
jgi:anti-sigma B factor antagonist